MEVGVRGARGANADGRWMVVVLAGQVTDRRSRDREIRSY